MTKTKQNSRCLFPALACVLAAIGFAQAQPPDYRVIHNFASYPHGWAPYAPLMRDTKGDLYGTTNLGGGAGNAGVVFKIDTAGQKVIYTFTGGTDGGNPYSGLAGDSVGNLYGTTYQGGVAGAGASHLGAGVVYKIDAAGSYSTLYAFTGGADGSGPFAGVIPDGAGNLYGTTYNGGAHNAGVVFKVSPAGQEVVIYSFTGGNDGANPYAGVIADASGNLYGTTQSGGANGVGVVYKLDSSGAETVLHTFSNNGKGGAPYAGVILDPAGNLYGTSGSVIYKLDPTGKYTELRYYALAVNNHHWTGLVRDAAGNLYGAFGPAQGESSWPAGGVYKLDTARNFRVLYKFEGATAPPYPGPGVNSSVILDAKGGLYGSTPFGGLAGMVYRIDAGGKEESLYSFPAARRGTLPWTGVIRDAAGNLYGTTRQGGSPDHGVLYTLDTSGHEKVLHTFVDGVGDGLARDAAGNLYGTAGVGSVASIFKLGPSGNYAALYTFTGGADGTGSDGVALGPDGSLYGVGGGSAAPAGLVYKLDPSGHFTVLYTFTGGADGGNPNPAVTVDPEGDLYGTTPYGGLGNGVIYKIDTAGRYTVLHSFQAETDGSNPIAGVTLDAAGNLYGTNPNSGPGGAGVVFEFDVSHRYTVLHAFGSGAEGNGPFAGVVLDDAGNIYGATLGGAPACLFGCGSVYRINTLGELTVMHSFTGGADGGTCYGSMILGPTGELYGAAHFGGTGGGGVVFKVDTITVAGESRRL